MNCFSSKFGFSKRVDFAKEFGVRAGAENVVEFLRRPNDRTPLLCLHCRHRARNRTNLRARSFHDGHERERFFDHFAMIVLEFGLPPVGFGVQFDELGVVVKHLLEVRHGPSSARCCSDGSRRPGGRRFRRPPFCRASTRAFLGEGFVPRLPGLSFAGIAARRRAGNFVPLEAAGSCCSRSRRTRGRRT